MYVVILVFAVLFGVLNVEQQLVFVFVVAIVVGVDVDAVVSPMLAILAEAAAEEQLERKYRTICCRSVLFELPRVMIVDLAVIPLSLLLPPPTLLLLPIRSVVSSSCPFKAALVNKDGDVGW